MLYLNIELGGENLTVNCMLVPPNVYGAGNAPGIAIDKILNSKNEIVKPLPPALAVILKECSNQIANFLKGVV